MALVVNHPETTPSSTRERLSIAIGAGVVYVLGSLGVLFRLLPWVWWVWLGVPENAGNFVLLILLGLGAATALGYLGFRLIGPAPIPGLRAGLFLALFSLLLVLLLTRLVSTWTEYGVYEARTLSEPVGLGLTIGVALGLLVLVVRLFFYKTGWQQRLIAFEEQGWFSTSSYKRSQGQRVRRGTILGLLILVGAGIYTLLAHRLLDNLGTRDWVVNIPFTGRVTVNDPGDASKAGMLPPEMQQVLGETQGDGSHDLEALRTVDLHSFRSWNEDLQKNYVRIEKPNDSSFAPGEVVRKSQLEEEERTLKARIDPSLKDDARRKAETQALPTTKPPALAKGDVRYLTLTLLPNVKLTLPLLLAGLCLWLAWRVVNLPPFADFLIATEAELNKVSWTTRRRLIQDTVVVLTTVVLLTLFLFAVDVIWSILLSWKPIGVLKVGDPTQQVLEKKGESW
jgi:preprotein translocase SecE subunit